nr:Chain F, Uncharacterized protein Rv3403c [Mycobacterium sp.]
MTMITPPTF